MTTTRRRWPAVAGALLVVAGVVGALVVGAMVAGTLFFRERVTIARDTPTTEALGTFAAQKAKFADAGPLLVLDERRRPAYAPGAEARRRAGAVSDLHVLVWNADQSELVTVTVPMWLLRLKSGPIAFGEYVTIGDGGVHLSPQDLDRHGPGVVLDFESPEGDRVLLTAQ